VVEEQQLLKLANIVVLYIAIEKLYPLLPERPKNAPHLFDAAS